MRRVRELRGAAESRSEAPQQVRASGRSTRTAASISKRETNRAGLRRRHHHPSGTLVANSSAALRNSGDDHAAVHRRARQLGRRGRDPRARARADGGRVLEDGGAPVGAAARARRRRVDGRVRRVDDGAPGRRVRQPHRAHRAREGGPARRLAEGRDGALRAAAPRRGGRRRVRDLERAAPDGGRPAGAAVPAVRAAGRRARRRLRRRGPVGVRRGRVPGAAGVVRAARARGHVRPHVCRGVGQPAARPPPRAHLRALPEGVPRLPQARRRTRRRRRRRTRRQRRRRRRAAAAVVDADRRGGAVDLGAVDALADPLRPDEHRQLPAARREGVGLHRHEEALGPAAVGVRRAQFSAQFFGANSSAQFG